MFTLGGVNGNFAVAVPAPQCEHPPLDPIRPIPWRHLCHCRCHRKWVSNPFHEAAVDGNFAVAIDAPPCEQSNVIALNPFIGNDIVAVAAPSVNEPLIVNYTITILSFQLYIKDR